MIVHELTYTFTSGPMRDFQVITEDHRATGGYVYTAVYRPCRIEVPFMHGQQVRTIAAAWQYDLEQAAKYTEVLRRAYS